MKAHPAFVEVLEAIKLSIERPSYIVDKITDWQSAGYPVVEEEKVEATENPFWRSANLIPKEKYEADLSAANERIRELEREMTLRNEKGREKYYWPEHHHRISPFGTSICCRKCHDAALEEAAHYVDRLGLHPDFNPEQHAGVCATIIRDGSKVAEGIRALKKEAK